MNRENGRNKTDFAPREKERIQSRKVIDVKDVRQLTWRFSEQSAGFYFLFLKKERTGCGA